MLLTAVVAEELAERPTAEAGIGDVTAARVETVEVDVHEEGRLPTLQPAQNVADLGGGDGVSLAVIAGRVGSEIVQPVAAVAERRPLAEERDQHQIVAAGRRGQPAQRLQRLARVAARLGRRLSGLPRRSACRRDRCGDDACW